MAGIIISSSVGWAATGKMERITLPVEFSIPLQRRPGAAEGTQVSLTVVLPSGNNLPTTVNPSDIPLDDFKKFPFRPLVVQPPSTETAVLVAANALGSNSSTTPSHPVVLPGKEVTVKYGGQVTDPVKLNVQWIWKITCKGRGSGVQNDLFVPLKLDGDSNEGWQTPVTLQLLLHNGDVYETQTVDPKDIPLRKFKDFTIPTPLGSANIELTVTALQTGGPGTTLVVGDVNYKPLVRRN